MIVSRTCAGDWPLFSAMVAEEIVGRLDGRLIRADKEGVVFRRRGLHRRVFTEKSTGSSKNAASASHSQQRVFARVALAPERFEYQHRQNGEGT